MREFLEDFRNNWQNSYWWADHPGLRAFLIGVMLGVLTLIFRAIGGERVQAVRIVPTRER